MQTCHVNFPSKDFESKYMKKNQYNVIPVLLGNKEEEICDVYLTFICPNIEKYMIVLYNMF